MKNKVLMAVVSVLISFGLWLYVITVISPGSEKTYYDIPIILQNESVLTERGLMITDIDDSTVTLDLAGNRSDLNNLNESNINIFVNVSSINAPGTHKVNYTVSFPGNMANNAVTTQNGTPSNITIQVENRVAKRVDVELEYIGSVPSGFLADKENAVLDYESIEISGPQSVIEKIQSARIQVDLTDQAQTVAGQYDYTLCDANGDPVDAQLVTTNVESISVTVKVLRVKEVELKVNVINGGGATVNTCTIEIEPAKIRVSGSEALLENLDILELDTINLGEMLSDATLVYPIVLPEGVTNETGLTEAKVEVKFPNLMVKSLNVTRINAINVPEGMEVDMITQALEVKVRGPKALVEALTEDNITATVDFTGVPLGTATMGVTIEIGGNFADVGAVGTYSVSATLREKDDTAA